MLRATTNFRWLLVSLPILVCQLAVIKNQASPLGDSQHQQSADKEQRYSSSSSNQQQSNRFFGQELRLHKLTDSTDSGRASSNATCNDGSPAGYYMRLNRNSKRWIIYLQGGFFCATDETCRDRWIQNPDLMSSNNWPQFKTGK